MPWKFPESSSSQETMQGPVDETALHRQRGRGKSGIQFGSIVSLVKSIPKKMTCKEQGLRAAKLPAGTGGRAWAGCPQDSCAASLLQHQQRGVCKHSCSCST